MTERMEAERRDLESIVITSPDLSSPVTIARADAGLCIVSLGDSSASGLSVRKHDRFARNMKNVETGERIGTSFDASDFPLKLRGRPERYCTEIT